MPRPSKGDSQVKETVMLLLGVDTLLTVSDEYKNEPTLKKLRTCVCRIEGDVDNLGVR